MSVHEEAEEEVEEVQRTDRDNIGTTVCMYSCMYVYALSDDNQTIRVHDSRVVFARYNLAQ